MENNDLFYNLISDILKTEDVLLSINSGGGICETRVEKGTPFKIKDRWATIGDDKGPWHIHLNVEKVNEAKFIQEPRDDGKNSYSIRFFDSEGNLSMRANFTKMYDNSGNAIKEKAEKYDEIFRKHGSKESLTLS
jgi:putative heme iron utilization protein